MEPRFVGKCCPGVSMEEWNVFLSLLEMDKVEEVLEEEQEEGEENDDDEENNLYTRPTKGRKQKERTRKNKQK